jgi:hypothetical protein
MSWVTLTSGQTDAESPVNDTIMDQIRDNEDYLFDSAVRGGTLTSPVRLAVARGEKTSLSIAATTQTAGIYRGGTSVTITFATDADDGDPDFSVQPRVYVQFKSQDADMTSTNYCLVTPFVYSDSPTTAVVYLNGWAPASTTITGNLYWTAIGIPQSGE